MFCAALLLLSAIGGGVGATTPGADVATNTSATNSTTTPHENPDEIQQDGDTERVSTYLEGRLGDRLTESALAISAGEYDRGRALLGDEYGSLFEQYSSIAQDLDEEELASRFNLTRAQQRSVVDSIEELNATRAEYEQAVEAGDEDRRRELARELLEGAEELNQTASELNQQYTALSNATTIDFAEAQSAIEESQVQVTDAAAFIAQREFTATQLQVDTNRTAISTGSPAAVTGQLTAANGTPVANAPVQFQLGADTITTTTDQNGTFRTVYRPLLAATTATNLSVSYTPRGSAPYLPARQTVPLTISAQANSSVTLTNTTTTAAFSQPVRAVGRVQVADAPGTQLAGIPLVLRVDGRRLATATTNETGAFDIAGALPASVPAGETTLTVAIDRRDAAIARATATTEVTVTATPTTLSLTATPPANETGNLTVTGDLRVEAGDALAERAVTLTVDGTVVETVTTDPTGQYRATVALPAEMAAGDAVTVTAQFEPTGTNLAATTATQQVTLPTPPAADGGGTASAAADSNPVQAVLIGGLLITVIVLVGARRTVWRAVRHLGVRLGVIERPATTTGAAASPGATASTATSNGDATATEESATGSRSPAERAQAALAAGNPDAAVQIAYAGVRDQLQSAAADDVATHWEFYRRWQDTAPVDRTQLQTITEAYETATFAPDPIAAGTAADAVTVSKNVTSEDDSLNESPSSTD